MNDTPEAMLARLQQKLRGLEAEVAELAHNQADALGMLIKTMAALRGSAETAQEQRQMRLRQQDITTARGEFHLAIGRQMEILSEVYTLTGQDTLADQSELNSAEHFNYGYDAMAVAAGNDQDPLYHLNRSKSHEYAAKAIRLRGRLESKLTAAEVALQVERAQYHEEEAERHKGVFEYLTGRKMDDGSRS